MQHKLFRFHALLHNWRFVFSEEMLAIILVLFVFITPADATTRFTDRSLTVYSSAPAATTTYKLALRYMTPAAVGSLDMLFCLDPIPYMPCVTPPGMDASGATLSAQTGETGFTIGSKSANHIVLTRSPTMISTSDVSTYTFDGIKNPTNSGGAFSIRLRSHGTTDASGVQIDFGSVRSEITTDISLETQVPPMLIFCLAEEVQDNCAGTNDNYYTDMGNLSSDTTLIAQSQMAVGTNASGGFAITANGTPPTAGTSVIDGLASPTLSIKGTNQFGINLVENTAPAVGQDPAGTWANATPSTDYGTPNLYKYVPGDVVAHSPNVSLMKKFTVSYILNASDSLRAGVYTTTITFIASGRF